LDAIEAMEGYPGSPVTYQQLSSLYPGLIRQIMAQAPKGMTAAERAQFVKDYIRERQTEAGESPFKAMRQEIAEARGERAKNLDRAQGVALLEAAREALQPGGTMRGLAGAAAAFGGSYGRALQADRAERRSLANMEMNIADAERKERMGLYGEARALRTAAAKERRDADRFEQDRRANLVRLASGIERGLRPSTSAGKPPTPPKLPEQTRADILAELLATEKPNEGESQDAFKARMAAKASREALALARTSESGPGKLGAAEDVIKQRIFANVAKAMRAYDEDPRVAGDQGVVYARLLRDARAAEKRGDPESLKIAEKLRAQAAPIRKAYEDEQRRIEEAAIRSEGATPGGAPAAAPAAAAKPASGPTVRNW
jgi:hypothetical protein